MSEEWVQPVTPYSRISLKSAVGILFLTGVSAKAGTLKAVEAVANTQVNTTANAGGKEEIMRTELKNKGLTPGLVRER